MKRRSIITKSPAGVYAAIGLGLTGVFLAVAERTQALIYILVNASAVIAVLIGTRRIPRGSRAPWLLLAIGLSATGSGDIIWTVYEQVLRSDAPFPSLADAL